MNTVILADNLKFPEGPVVTKNGDIYFVELLGGCITHYDRETQKITRIDVGGAPNGLLVKDQNTLLFCDSKQNAIRSLNLTTKITKTIVDSINGLPLSAPNDLIMDKDGRILFTCPGGSQKEPIGYLCVINIDNTITIIAKDMYFPNGLLLINDDRKLIINETWKHRLIIGDWNKDTLSIERIKPFAIIGGDAEPDGLTESKDGRIYAAVYNTSHVWVFDKKGNLQEKIKVPGKSPTNLCFDNYGDLGLLVTEAENGLLVSINK